MDRTGSNRRRCRFPVEPGFASVRSWLREHADLDLDAFRRSYALRRLAIRVRRTQSEVRLGRALRDEIIAGTDFPDLNNVAVSDFNSRTYRRRIQSVA